MRNISDKYQAYFIYLALTAVTLAVFWQVHSFEFTDYDDDAYVSRNSHISSGLRWDNVVWVFTSEHGGNWHPLTGLSHMLDCQLFGLNPGWHHIVNLLFHIANTLLLFTVLRRMTDALWQSAFVAALFALHPLHVESVAWIFERKDVLSIFFWMITMLCYFWYVEHPNVRRYLLTLFVFALGLMAKPMLVTLPFVFLLLDYWPINRLQTHRAGRIEWQGCYSLIYEKIPFFVLSIISSIITFLIQRSVGAMVETNVFPLTSRVANAAVSYVRYIVKMVLPTHLAAFYPYSETVISAWLIIAVIITLLMITICVITAGKYRYLFTGWFWYMGTLIPVIGLVQVGEQAMADRYTYVSLIGLFIIIAWGANDLLIKWRSRKIILSLSSLVIISTLSVCTWIQTGYWHDSISLFGHALKVAGKNYLAYNNRGLAYYVKGKYDLAFSDFNEAIEINPGYADAYFNRGTVYSEVEGRYDLAIADYSKTLDINPRYPKLYNNRGTTYYKKGEFGFAIADYSRAIEIEPTDVYAYNNRGLAYYGEGRYDLALSDFNKAIEIKPDNADAYFNRGTVYSEVKGQYDLAVTDYNKTLEINPRYPKVYNNRGVTYYRKGEFDLAIADYSKAIEIDPMDADAYNNRGSAYWRGKGRYDLAISDFKKAIEINPRLVEAYFNKASACESAGRKTEAIEAYNAFILYAPVQYAPNIEQAKQKIRELGQ